MPGLDDIKKLADEHDAQVDQGLEKIGDLADDKIGHEAQVEQGVDWAQQHTGAGDTQDKS